MFFTSIFLYLKYNRVFFQIPPKNYTISWLYCHNQGRKVTTEALRSGEKCQNLTELEIFCCWDRVFKTKSPYGAYGGEFKGTWKHFCPVGILTHILSLFPQLWHFFHLTSPLFYWAVILIIVTVFIRQAVKSTRHPKKLADQH